MLECLCDVARVSPGDVQPWLLGLCVDVVVTAQRRGEYLAAFRFSESPASDQSGWLAC